MDPASASTPQNRLQPTLHPPVCPIFHPPPPSECQQPRRSHRQHRRQLNKRRPWEKKETQNVFLTWPSVNLPIIKLKKFLVTVLHGDPVEQWLFVKCKCDNHFAFIVRASLLLESGRLPRLAGRKKWRRQSGCNRERRFRWDGCCQTRFRSCLAWSSKFRARCWPCRFARLPTSSASTRQNEQVPCCAPANLQTNANTARSSFRYRRIKSPKALPKRAVLDSHASVIPIIIYFNFSAFYILTCISRTFYKI